MCVSVPVSMCLCDPLLVNTISQEQQLGPGSYLVCRSTTLSRKSLLFVLVCQMSYLVKL